MAAPGTQVHGRDDIRAALHGLLGLQPTMDVRAGHVIENGNVALFVSQWTMTLVGEDGETIRQHGTTSDVIRRQTDGTWRLVIDNPYGPGAWL